MVISQNKGLRLEDNGGLVLTDQGLFDAQTVGKPTITKYLIDKKCIAGTVYDSVFGECLQCQDIFGCKNCDESGCITCNNANTPLAGKCLVKWEYLHTFLMIN